MALKRLAKTRARAGSSSSKTLAKKIDLRRGAPLAAKRLPAVENRHHVEHGHAVTYELRPVLCGKPNCRKHHGPYWYAYWSQGGRVRTVYIGKAFRKVSDKCPEAFRAGERFGRS